MLITFDTDDTIRLHGSSQPSEQPIISWASPILYREPNRIGFVKFCNDLRTLVCRIISLLIATTLLVSGGESSLTITYQLIEEVGCRGIRISQVTCHDWYSHSGMTTQIGLISAPNVAPTNNPKEATEDLNLASTCGIHFYSSDIGNPQTPLELTLSAIKLAIPANRMDQREAIIRASLECLRRCLPDRLLKIPLTLQAGAGDTYWMTKIVSEFNAHDRTKVFFTP